MASSPAEQQLARIGDLYEAALEAVDAEDLQRVQALTNEVDLLLSAVAELPAPTAVELQAHERAALALARLRDRVSSSLGDAREALSRGRRGLKLLSAYRGRLIGTGLRVECDAE